MSVHRTLTDGATILALTGKIGNANTETSTEMWRFFAPVSVHRTLAAARQYIALTGKIGNANTEASTEMWRLFAPVSGPVAVPNIICVQRT